MKTNKQKPKFKLSIGSVEHIINTRIKKEFRTYTFKVRQSNWSQSIYIDVFQDKSIVGKIRISDHSSVSHCRDNLVVERSSCEKVIRMIKNELGRIKRGSTWKILEKM